MPRKSASKTARDYEIEMSAKGRICEENFAFGQYLEKQGHKCVKVDGSVYPIEIIWCQHKEGCIFNLREQNNQNKE